ncbi:MAG: hypothetical protein D6760_09915, partial [Deltaproteobacteria bacterium]
MVRLRCAGHARGRRVDIRVLRRQQCRPRRRTQRGQRHFGRFPRTRHARRNFGAGGRRTRVVRRDRRCPGAEEDGMTPSLILSTAARAASWLLFGFAAVLFLKGHNSPGGGFIAGLLAATGIVLQLVAYGHDSRRIEPGRFTLLIAIGLGLAVGTAAVPALLGHAFFTHTFGFVHVPMLGEVELATASLFDLG